MVPVKGASRVAAEDVPPVAAVGESESDTGAESASPEEG